MGKTRPRISACMIVKNEERLLSRCLESIKDAVSEIVVVDTGSSDRTPEIAATFGAKVYHHPWENDFSKHRNQSLSYASGEWILVVDADEELRQGDASRILETIARLPNEVDALAIDVTDVDNVGTRQSTVNTIRIFRNGLGIHYEGIVHNQLIGCTNVHCLDSVIFHYGCYLSPEKMAEKRERTRSLLLRRLTETPEDIFILYYLTFNYAPEGDPYKVLEYGEKTIKLLALDTAVHPSYISVYVPVILACMRTGQLHKAESLCLEAIGISPAYLDAYWLLTDVHFGQGKHGEVVRIGKMAMDLYECLRNGDASARLNIPLMYLNAEGYVLIRMGLACLARGDLANAERYLDKALACHPKKREALAESVINAKAANAMALTRKYALRGIEDFPDERLFAATLMEDAIGRDDQNLMDLVSKACLPRIRDLLWPVCRYYMEKGDSEKAMAACNRSIGRDPPDPNQFVLRASVRARSGDALGALQDYTKALELDVTLHEVWTGLGFLFLETGKLEEAETSLRKALSIHPRSLGAHMGFFRLGWEKREPESLVSGLENLLDLLEMKGPFHVSTLEDMAGIVQALAERMQEKGLGDLGQVASALADEMAAASTTS